MSRPTSPAARAAALAEVYAQIPAIDCRGQCHDSCGPIQMTRTEHRRIETAHGVSIPNRTLRDAGVRCEALTFLKRCAVYPDRPVLCRLWGVLDIMPCTYGCRPERYLTAAQGVAAARRFRAGAHGLASDPERTAQITPAFRAFAQGRITEGQLAARIQEVDGG